MCKQVDALADVYTRIRQHCPSWGANDRGEKRKCFMCGAGNPLSNAITPKSGVGSTYIQEFHQGRFPPRH